MINLKKGQEKADLLHDLNSMYNRELDRQWMSRLQRTIDADFYHDRQFSVDEIAKYHARGQSALAYNEIKPAILWVLGTERRSRTDWNIAPREEDDVERANIKTKLVKYIDDINKARFHRSMAFEDTTKTGEGWIEICVRRDEKHQPMVVIRHVHWSEILLDSTDRSIDMSTARHLFRTKLVDLDEIKQHFPDAEEELESDSRDMESLVDEDRHRYTIDNTWQTYDGGTIRSMGSLDIGAVKYADGCRQAVRVVECWQRIPRSAKVLDGDGEHAGTEYDDEDDDHKQMVSSGEYSILNCVVKEVWCSIFTEKTLLWHAKSPYKHNKFPYVRRVCQIDDKTGEPVGMIRSIRPIQMDLNHRKNKALFLLSTKRVIMDKGAHDDIKKLEEEMARPDAIIEVKNGANFKVDENVQLATAHIQFAEQDSASIRQVSGVTGENQGMQTNATSGIAIQARQEQGGVITTAVFDNHSLAHQQEGEICLSLVEQFLTRKMQFRISGSNGKHEFVMINDRPETDITATQADFIVTEKAYNITQRAALAGQLMALSGQLASINPQLGLAALEMAMKFSDLPDLDKLMADFRRMSGQPDPDESDEQRAAREQQAAQQQQQQQQMMMQKFQGEMRAIAAKAFRDESAGNEIVAKADKAKADADKVRAEKILVEMEAILSAFTSAGLVVAQPAISPTADYLLKNASAIISPQGTDEPDPAAQQQQPPAQQQMQPPVQVQQPPAEQTALPAQQEQPSNDAPPPQQQ